MFVIYLGDVMEDYEAIDHKAKLISRQQITRDPDAETKQLTQRLGKLQDNKTPENTSPASQEYNKQNQQTLQKKNNTPPENQENTKQTPDCEKQNGKEEEQGKQKKQQLGTKTKDSTE